MKISVKFGQFLERKKIVTWFRDTICCILRQGSNASCSPIFYPLLFSTLLLHTLVFSTNSPTSTSDNNMPKRKATAIEANNENERVSTLKTPGGPAIYAANDKIARKVLHSRPKPPAKRQRQSAKGDKPLRKAKASKAQKEAEVNTLATTSAPLATAASLPPEIWRLIGEMVNISFPSTQFRTARK